MVHRLSALFAFLARAGRRSLVGLPVALVPAAGQAPPAGTTSIPVYQQDWRWIRFGVETGLPSGRLLEVLESAGVSWVVTDLGTAWFDGYRWRRLAGNGPPALGPHRLVPDGRGGAWGIDRGAPVHVTRAESRRLLIQGPASLATIRSVTPIDSASLLLLADSVIYRLDDQSGASEVEPVPEAARGPLRSPDARLLRTRPGHVWLITSHGIWLRNGRGWSHWSDLTAVIFRETDAGGLLSASGPSADLFEWRPGGRPTPLALPGSPVSALSVGPVGHVVVVFWDGRAAIRRNGHWSWVDPAPEPLQWTRQIVHRDNGDFWAIGPKGLYLFRASGRRWTHYRIPGRDEFTGFVNAMLRSREGELWLGTERGLVRQRPGGVPIETGVINGVPLRGVTGLAQDPAGGIWIGSGSAFEGAFRFDGSRWRHYGPAEGLPAPRVHRIVTTRDGAVWFLGLDSTYTGGPGAFRWDGTRFSRIGPAEGLPGGRVFAFDEGPDGALWFGTDSGLARLHRDRWTRWPASAAGVDARVYTLAADSSGGVWFGHRSYGAGLGHLTPDGRLERVDLGEGTPANEVNEVRIGPDGSLWFTTPVGLGRLRGGTVSFFDRSSGLDNPRLWPVLPFRDRVLAGGEGVFELDLREAAFPPPTIEVAEPLAYASQVLLRWTPLAAWGVTPSDRIETRYRVDGADWSRWSLTRQLSLLGVSPGRHRLEVEAKGLFGEISHRPAGVGFITPPPWYRSSPILVALALVIGALGTLTVLYLGRLRQHQQALDASRRAVQRLADSVPSILFQFELDSGRMIYVNREVERLLGYRPEELTGRRAWWELVDASDGSGVAEHLARLRRARDGETVETEMQLRSAGGEVRTLAIRSTVFTRWPDQRPETVLSVGQDVSAQRHLEAQLVQAQKMETVGRLAGGVAHDFNNILTAIIGYAELARQTAGPDEATRGDLDEITRAAERARTLTSQLLTFARRQVVETRVVDVNGLVTDIDRMLRRLIGADVELVTRLAADLWPIRADPSHLEQVLVNLAVNARDAMPAGGRLTISTANLPTWDGVGPGGERVDGPCVLVTVADTGAGMTEAVRSRIFEPFFTTKAPGLGTGLGLSTCYGMIRQAGGVIAVDSIPDGGTTFRVALPRAERPDPTPARTGLSAALPRGSETILLVEDEGPVRNLSARILRQAGYQVIEAPNGREALRLYERLDRPPDLLLSDVVMPEMGGPELWTELRGRQPSLLVLFVSGYTENSLVIQGIADRTLPFLAKPYTGTALAQRVREVLDAARA